ncbi:MAG: hypothetical protein IJQ67_03310 [Bacilli bacterium]|nr:hypothetical protein [Bacilli bacterium]
MKRIIKLSLATILSLCALTGCNNKKKDSSSSISESEPLSESISSIIESPSEEESEQLSEITSEEESEELSENTSIEESIVSSESTESIVDSEEESIEKSEEESVISSEIESELPFESEESETESIVGSIEESEESIGSLESEGHRYVYYEEVLPSFYYDGYKAHYECNDCDEVFDLDYNLTTREEITLPHAEADMLSIAINGEEKAQLELTHNDDEYATWTLVIDHVDKDDVVTLVKKGDATYLYSFFGNGNIDADGKILTTGDEITFNLSATPNGFNLDVSGYKYEGLVVRINNVDYPMHAVTYYDKETKTNIYGWHYFNKDDSMLIVNTLTDEEYGYSDLDDSMSWNIFDYHAGENNEIIFDYGTYYGIEFDRADEKTIMITKTFAPRDGNAYQVVFDSERENVDLVGTRIDDTEEDYEEMMWYASQEEVENGEAFLEYVNEHGLYVYSATIDLSQNEKFNLLNLTDNLEITADHVINIFAQDNRITCSEGYITALVDGKFSVSYLPAYDSIYLSELVVSNDAYLYLNGSFIGLQKDADNVVHYENLVTESEMSYVAFADAQYTLFEDITLDSEVDTSLVYISSSLIYFMKKGTYNLHLNLDTHVLSVDVVDLVKDPFTDGYVLYQKKYYALEANPENENEIYVKNLDVASFSTYATFSDKSYNLFTDFTLDESSSSYVMSMSGLMYFIQTGLFNIYININTYVVRVVKVGESGTFNCAIAIDFDYENGYVLTQDSEDINIYKYEGLVVDKAVSLDFFDPTSEFSTTISVTLSEDVDESVAVWNSETLTIDLVGEGTYNIYLNRMLKVVTIEKL